MRIVVTSLFAAAAAASLLVTTGCAGSQDPGDDTVSSGALVATYDPTSDGTAPDENLLDDTADGAVDDGAVDDGAVDDGAVDDGAVDDGATNEPTTLPSTDRVTVSIRFVEPPSEQTLESLEVLGVIFAERDGERIAVGPVYTATVPEGMIEALEATAEIADVEVSGQRRIILPDGP